MPKNNSDLGLIARDYLESFPNHPTLTIAKMLMSDYPGIYDDLEKTKRVIDLYLKEHNGGAYQYSLGDCTCGHKVTFTGYDNNNYCLKCHKKK